MSYKTYTTEALVCGSNSSNTSDRSFLLFTREAGMLFASARSVREERSKQRYALQDFSHIRVSLVKGKSGWRIGSVESMGNAFLNAANRTERSRVNFVIAQLRRFVHGEVSLTGVYDDAIELFKACKADETTWEIYRDLFLLRLHAYLGYIAVIPIWEKLTSCPSLAEALKHYEPTMHAQIARAVEHATEASHL